MANNDKLKQIISNLQILSDLTTGMIDLEIYPVSFFSQAFDLVQKIHNDIHGLEAEQVEMFATQMKKHQDLILSIHQQMRVISANTQTQEPEQQTNTAKESSSITFRKPDENKVVSSEKTEAVPQKEDKPKKVSLLSRIGITTPDSNPKETVPPAIDSPIKVPVKKTVTVDNPTEPVAEKPSSVTANTIKNKEAENKSTITTPASGKKVIQQERERPVEEPKVADKIVKQQVKTSESPAGTINEIVAPPSVNEVIEKNKLSDLRKAFSLNDRFRYRRELFGGNEETMNKVITILNSKGSFKESVKFLEEKLHWDFSNPIVKDFVKVLEIRFL